MQEQRRERDNASTRRVIQIFSAKLVLEVFGGAGAIWGFSEAVGLRNKNTEWFWRPCALVFGVVFFIRWILQIRDYLHEEKRSQRRETYYRASDRARARALASANAKKATATNDALELKHVTTFDTVDHDEESLLGRRD